MQSPRLRRRVERCTRSPPAIAMKTVRRWQTATLHWLSHTDDGFNRCHFSVDAHVWLCSSSSDPHRPLMPPASAQAACASPYGVAGSEKGPGKSLSANTTLSTSSTSIQRLCSSPCTEDMAPRRWTACIRRAQTVSFPPSVKWAGLLPAETAV